MNAGTQNTLTRSLASKHGESCGVASFSGSDHVLRSRDTLLHICKTVNTLTHWSRRSDQKQPVSQRKYYLQMKYYAEIVLFLNRRKLHLIHPPFNHKWGRKPKIVLCTGQKKVYYVGARICYTCITNFITSRQSQSIPSAH